MRTGEVAASVALFRTLAHAHAAHLGTDARSGDDKEFAAEDWVARAVAGAGLQPAAQGRHAPVDFTVDVMPSGPGEQAGGASLALQVKGLTRKAGKRVRADLDYNGTLPTPRHEGCPVLLVYTELEHDGAARKAKSVVVADMALVQDEEHQAASSHVKGYGSFGDVSVRMRLMYVGAQPVALAAEHGLDVSGCATLMLAQGALSERDATRWGLLRCGMVRRAYSQRRLAAVTFPMDGSAPEPVWEPVPARPDRIFDVWSLDPGAAADARCVALPRPVRQEQLQLL